MWLSNRFELYLLSLLLIAIAAAAWVYWRAYRMISALHSSRAARDRGDMAAARKFAQLALARSLTDVDRANALDEWGDIHRFAGENTDSERCYREALDLRRLNLPPEHEDIGVSWHNVGLICFCAGKFADADQAFRNSFQKLSQARGENDPTLALTLGMQGMSLVCLGHFAVGVPLLEDSLRRTQAGYGQDHIRTADAWQRLGFGVQAFGRWGQSDEAFKRCYEILTRIQGNGDADRNAVLQLRGLLLVGRYRLVQDEAALSEVDELMTKHHAALLEWVGPEHHLTSNAALVLACVRMEQNRLAEALKLASDGLRVANKILGSEHLRTALGHLTLGRVLLATNQLESAEQQVRQSIAINEHGLGEGHFELGGFYQVLGAVAARQGNHADAERHLLHSLVLHEPLGPKNPVRVHALRELAAVYRATGRHADAETVEQEVTSLVEEAQREWDAAKAATS